MRAIRPESSFRTMLVPRRPRLRLVLFLVRMWLLNAWPALNLPDAVLRNRFAAARLVLILALAQLLRLCFCTGSSAPLRRLSIPARSGLSDSAAQLRRGSTFFIRFG